MAAREGIAAKIIYAVGTSCLQPKGTNCDYMLATDFAEFKPYLQAEWQQEKTLPVFFIDFYRFSTSTHPVN